MQKFQQYIKDVIQELKKVTWPSREELKGSTLVVLVFAILMGCFIASVDFGLSMLFSLFFKS